MIVALVNNMPDSAFIETEEQIRSLTAPSSAGENVELALYTITEIPRSDAIASVIQSRYRGLDQLWTHAPDALIVTGTEPGQAQLPYEPYWPYLAHLLEWAASSVPTTMLSCLAAHASVLLFDGIERVPRRVKCSGVYESPVENPTEPLVAGLPASVPIPHSRMNDVPEAAMIQAGYEIIIGSEHADVGWAVATRKRGDGRFVLCQGHTEYGTLSLLREYRRDVRRYLFGRGAVSYPRVPESYFGPDAVATLNGFERRATTWNVDPLKLWESFPYEKVVADVHNSWAQASSAFYANWLVLAGESVAT